MKYHITITILLLCMLSCSRHSVHWETLTQVETFMEAQPDSALTALQRIDAQELEKSRAFNPRWRVALTPCGEIVLTL